MANISCTEGTAKLTLSGINLGGDLQSLRLCQAWRLFGVQADSNKAV